MIEPIKETVIITRKRYHTNNGKKEDVKPPIYFCETCTKRNENRCSIYERYVILDYNRCFNHSNYSPIQAVFKVNENLDKIIEKEEQERLSA